MFKQFISNIIFNTKNTILKRNVRTKNGLNC